MTFTRSLRSLGATAMAAGLLLASAPSASADEVRDGQWPIQAFNLDKAWGVSKGDGIKVAVIDQGVDANHPDLAGQVLPGFDPSGQGLDRAPKNDHGTSMASIIAAKGHGSGAGVIGVAPGAKILPVYKTSAQNTDAIPEGIRWAVDNGAKVISISQGKGGVRSARYDDAVAYALGKDVLIVAASGNSGAAVEVPANAPGVLAVGSVGKDGRVSSDSNWGPELLLTGPGDDIVAAGDCAGSKYCLGGGTSQATAFVAGAAALVRAKYPDLTAGQVANRLTKSAKAPASVTKLPDAHYGYGTVRPYEALTQEMAAGPAQGPLAAVAGATASGGASAAAPTPGASAPAAGGAQAPVKEPEGFSILGKGIAVAAGVLLLLALLFVGLIVVLVKGSKRRREARQVPPAPAPYGYPPAQQQYPNQPYGAPQYGNQAPPQGYPPHGGQPPQPPYQNPYGSGGNQ
ncbi:S8 family serine peptidase [Kitasatospora sp. NPDC004289]